jgi:hypothetical protein
MSSAQQIAFSWSDGVDNGGMPILDYSVYYKNLTGEFILLDTVSFKQYRTSMELVLDQD